MKKYRGLLMMWLGVSATSMVGADKALQNWPRLANMGSGLLSGFLLIFGILTGCTPY